MNTANKIMVVTSASHWSPHSGYRFAGESPIMAATINEELAMRNISSRINHNDMNDIVVCWNKLLRTDPDGTLNLHFFAHKDDEKQAAISPLDHPDVFKVAALDECPGYPRYLIEGNGFSPDNNPVPRIMARHRMYNKGGYVSTRGRWGGRIFLTKDRLDTCDMDDAHVSKTVEDAKKHRDGHPINKHFYNIVHSGSFVVAESAEKLSCQD